MSRTLTAHLTPLKNQPDRRAGRFSFQPFQILAFQRLSFSAFQLFPKKVGRRRSARAGLFPRFSFWICRPLISAL